MEGLYRMQLRKVLRFIPNKLSEMINLANDKMKIEIVSKESKWKKITLEEIDKRLNAKIDL